MDFGSSFGQLLHHGLLDLRWLSNNIVINRCRSRQIQLVCSLDVCGLFEEVHQLRQVEELCKAGSRAVSGALRRKLNGSRSFTEGRCPTVKMRQPLVTNGIVLEIAHHGIEFRHGVGDRCAGGKDHALAVGHFINIAAFQQHIRGLLCIRGR